MGPFSTIYFYNLTINLSNIPRYGSGQIRLFAESLESSNSIEIGQCSSTSNTISGDYTTSYLTLMRFYVKQDAPGGVGKVDLLKFSFNILENIVNDEGQTPIIPRKFQIQAQPATTSQVVVLYKPKDQSAPYAQFNATQTLNAAGAAIAGWYNFDPTANGMMASTAYDIVYRAYDVNGNLLNVEGGTLTYDGSGNPLINGSATGQFTPGLMNGPGQAWMTSDGLVLTGRPSATQIKVRYRLTGSSGDWSSATSVTLSPVAGAPGQFKLPTGGLPNGTSYDCRQQGLWQFHARFLR
jgi:hypothetical protein